MNLFINTDTRQAVLGVGNLAPVSTGQTVKVLDTPGLNIYFLAGSSVVDLGLSPFLKFEVIAATDTDASDPLVYDTTFNRGTDATGNVCYQGFPQFHTTNVMAALGEAKSIDCLAEVRYQLPSGEISRSQDIPFVIMRAIIAESGTPDPTVIPGYPDASLLVLTTSGGEPFGYATLGSDGKLTPDQLNLTDFQTALGVTVINQAIGIFNRLIAGTGISFDTTTTPGAVIINCTVTSGGTTVALTDAESSVGATLISDASGILKRLAAGVGVTLDTGTTPGAIIINTSGVQELSDFETSTGTSLIHTVTGILQRLVAGTGITFDTTTTPGAIILNVTGGGGGTLTDFETSLGVSLIHTSPFVLNRLFAGTGITFDIATTPGAIIINASGSGLTLVDAETSTGDTLLGSTNGQIKRLVAGTNMALDAATTPGAVILNASGGLTLADEETSTGQTLRGATNGLLKRLIAGTGMALDNSTTPGAVILNASGGGGSAVAAIVRLNATGPSYSDGGALAFDTAVSDPGSLWDGSTKLTAPSTGLYLVSANFSLQFGGNGVCQIGIYVNGIGSTNKALLTLISGVSGGNTIGSISGLIELTSGDYIQLGGDSNNGYFTTNPSNWWSSASGTVRVMGGTPNMSMLKVA